MSLQLQLVGAFLQLLSFVLQVAGVGRGGERVTSFIRTPERNAAVGGVPSSLHLLGLALDVAPVTGSLREAGRLWRQLGFDAIDEGDHMHFELDGPSFNARRLLGDSPAL